MKLIESVPERGGSVCTIYGKATIDADTFLVIIILIIRKKNHNELRLRMIMKTFHCKNMYLKSDLHFIKVFT